MFIALYVIYKLFSGMYNFILFITTFNFHYTDSYYTFCKSCVGRLYYYSHYDINNCDELYKENFYFCVYVTNVIFFAYSSYTPEELHAMVDLKPEKKEDD